MLPISYDFRASVAELPVPPADAFELAAMDRILDQVIASLEQARDAGAVGDFTSGNYWLGVANQNIGELNTWAAAYDLDCIDNSAVSS